MIPLKRAAAGAAVVSIAVLAVHLSSTQAARAQQKPTAAPGGTAGQQPADAELEKQARVLCGIRDLRKEDFRVLENGIPQESAIVGGIGRRASGARDDDEHRGMR